MGMYVATDRFVSMVKGDTLSFGLEFEGLDQDLDTAYLTCRKNFTEAPVFQKSLGDGITKQDVSHYVIRVAPEDTAGLQAGKYYYDLEIGANGDKFTILKGILELERDITY